MFHYLYSNDVNIEGQEKFKKLNTPSMIKNASADYYDNSRIYSEQKAIIFGAQYVREAALRK